MRLSRVMLGVVLVVIPTLAARSMGGDAPLADAAEHSDWARVRALIEQGVDVNQAQADGTTALHWAADLEGALAARLLVTARADVKATNRYGVTPLALACKSADPSIAVLLLEAGADPNASLKGGETVLMTAARSGNLGAVNALLERGARVDARDENGQTAIMWAAAEGHAPAIEALIKAGADFRTPLASGFTPLFFAVREGRTTVVRALIKAGAPVNEAMAPTRKPNGRSPLRGTSPLILAVENGHFELAAALLELGADPNDQRSGFTPLHTLTWVRKPNRGDGEDGEAAPIGSGNLSSLELVDRLVEHGADVNARLKRGASGRGVLGRAGATPFLLAAMTADLAFLRKLLSHGADPNLPNAQRATPLMAAAGLGSLAPGEEAGTEAEAIEAVNLLIGLGGDVNAVDDNGETAMHGAAYKSFPRVVELLAAKGARAEVWNRKNKYGWTPLAIAEGHRPGNFKPSPETMAALQNLLGPAGTPAPGPAASHNSGR